MRKISGFPFIIAIFVIATFMFGYALFQRIRFPYNEEGVFFDMNTGIVYSRESVIIYGLLTGIFLLLTFFLVYYHIKKSNKTRRK